MMEKYLYKVEKPMRLFFLFSLFDLLVGLVGMCVYGAYVNLNGPIWVRNQYIGLWLTTLIVITAIQSIYTELVRIKHRGLLFYLDFVYYLITVLISLLLTIFFGLSSKIDATIWSVWIFAVNLTNSYILFLKTKENQPENIATDFREEIQLPKEKITKYLFQALIIILKVFGLLFLCFVLNGSIVIGAGTVKYPARGIITNVALNDTTGRSLKIHYLCSGPKNSTEPVVLFEGDGAHGLADYLILQDLLARNNRRSCAWDKPGLGYSDYLYTDMTDYWLIYHNLIKQLKENGPFLFVGWGGGGEIVYEYAARHPEMVHSLLFLDVYPNNIEFKVPFILKNWTQTQYDQYKQEQLNLRFGLLRLINGLGVPWGLMEFFVPLPKTVYSDLIYEQNWYFLTEKTWSTQTYLLQTISKQSDVFQTLKINQNIPINLISSFKTDQQVISQICIPRKYAPDSTDCLYEINANKLYFFEKERLVNLTLNGKIIRCVSDDCDQGYLVGIGANFTVTSLLSF